MSHSHKFSSSPPQTDVAQGKWLNIRKRSRDNDEIIVVVETAKKASAEKRRHRATKTEGSNIGDLGDVESVGDETSTMRITNQLN